MLSPLPLLAPLVTAVPRIVFTAHDWLEAPLVNNPKVNPAACLTG